ncbi:MAG: c-type cytochrome [Acidobacteria bacterium]|nr:c-type cytochrome [Acidobacteriota bacterium]
MRGVVCAALTLAASFALWGRGSAQGPQVADRPVEQTRKNIQVLKGLPESQLLPEMNFIAASLGVQCGFCHVNKGRDPQTGQTNWVWESDENEHKKIAREMMRMVLTVNGGQFGLSRGQVTCYTCHRGQEHPPSLPTLPLAVSGHEPAPAARPTPPAGAAPGANAPRPAQPTVQQVFDKYVAAVGGQDALAKTETLTFKGTREASQGRVWPFEATVKGSDKFLMVVEIPQQGRFSQAVNGAAGWVVNPRSHRAVTPKELGDIKGVADMFRAVKFTPAQTMRVAGRRRVGDRDAVVVVDRPSEGVQRRYFFDAQTGLLLRILTLTDAILNQLPEQIDFEDYREVEGIKLPFTMRTSAIDTYNSFTRKLTEVRAGVSVEDTLFNMPAQPAPKP